MNITIDNIADITKLSKSTISKVLRNYPEISTETKERVLKVVNQLGYRPNYPLSANLAENNGLEHRTLVVNFVFYKQARDFLLKNSYFYTLTQYIHDLFKKNDYFLLESYPKNPNEFEKLLSSTTSDGFLLLSNIDKIEPQFIDRLLYFSMLKPIIFLSNYLPENDLQFHSVRVDNFAAGYKATAYCIQRGFKIVYFIGRYMNLAMARDRFLGYQKAMDEVKLPPRMIRYLDDDTPDLTEFDLMCSDEIGLVGSGDAAILHFAEHIKEKGGRQPNVHFVGIDNYPALTKNDVREATVEVDLKSMANQAYGLFQDILQRKTTQPKQVLVGSHVVSRTEL